MPPKRKKAVVEDNESNASSGKASTPKAAGKKGGTRKAVKKSVEEVDEIVVEKPPAKKPPAKKASGKKASKQPVNNKADRKVVRRLWDEDDEEDEEAVPAEKATKPPGKKGKKAGATVQDGEEEVGLSPAPRPGRSSGGRAKIPERRVASVTPSQNLEHLKKMFDKEPSEKPPERSQTPLAPRLPSPVKTPLTPHQPSPTKPPASVTPVPKKKRGRKPIVIEHSDEEDSDATEKETKKAKKSKEAKKTKQQEPPKASPEKKAGRRSVVIRDEPESVAVFKPSNPANVWGEEDYDWEQAEKMEEEEVLKERRKKQVLQPKATQRLSNNQQAFSIFAVPVGVDTNDLTIEELKQELRIRGRKVGGTKDELRKRLEEALQESPGPRKSRSPKVAKRPAKGKKRTHDADLGFDEFDFDDVTGETVVLSSDEDERPRRRSTGGRKKPKKK